MPRNIIDVIDLSVEEIDELIATAEDIITNPVKYQDICAHKQLATLFFEPSTRTRLSFESAMLALGGSVLKASPKPIPVPPPRVRLWGHRPHRQLLCRHHRHAPSQGGRALCRRSVQ